MSILDTDTRTPAQKAAAEIQQIIKQTFNMLKMNQTRGFSALWKNSRATPAEIFAALDSSAAEALRLGGIGADALNEAVAGSCTLALPGGVTINPDGTVTYTPPTEE
jgi:hypothetical protein